MRREILLLLFLAVLSCSATLDPQSLIDLLDAAEETASKSDETGSKHYIHEGEKLTYHTFHGYRVVDPTIEIEMGNEVKMHHGKRGYRLTFALSIKNDFDLPHSGGKWTNLHIKSVKCRIARRTACGSVCHGVTARVTKFLGHYRLNFYCHHRSVCRSVAHYLTTNDPRGDKLFSSLEFTIFGLVHSHRYVYKWNYGQSGGTGGENGGSSEFFQFEEGKALLYTIKSHIGKSAFETYKTKGNNEMPSDGSSLPNLYRSDQLDSLSSSVGRSGYKLIVAEMRVKRTVVAQVVFDVSTNTETVDMMNWFTTARMTRSFPYQLGKTGFNFFSIAGDQGLKRTFFINNAYGGCEHDVGFWVVSDGKDMCQWSSKGYKDSGPVLVYTQVPGIKYHEGNSFFADRFIIYLANDVSKPHPVPYPFYNFEGNVLLYTIKSNIGQTGFTTFKTKGNAEIPSDGGLPNLYRSGLVDTLPFAVLRSGHGKIVAEMRTGDKVVAQVVFDVSTNTEALNLVNWFSTERLMFSYPYKLEKTGYNYFSVDGDQGLKRTFLINKVYGGCANDIGFWVVSDNKDMCEWANNGWRGSAPALVYSQVPGKKYSEGNAYYADRFIIYLATTFHAPHPIKTPIFQLGHNRVLLYTIKSHIGQTAFATFQKRGNNEIPSDGSLPDLYRSDQLDALADTLEKSGYKMIVAEMRDDDTVVAQVVFDVSTKTSSVDATNWFSAERMVDSFPYKLEKTGFNIFSFAGDQGLKRTFFINKVYGGCEHDVGFWVVSDDKDMCQWSNKGWSGTAPVLVYSKVPGIKFFQHNAFYAERLVIYMTNDMPNPPLPKIPFFRFDGDKALLYTIKSSIGQLAFITYKTRGNDKIPSDGVMPDLYRSDQLDSLAYAIERTGYKRIVAEMLSDGKTMAFVAFDVSTNTKSLDMMNWFSQSRAVASYPYSLSKGGFNFFSIAGDQGLKRSFFINNVYGGCDGDIGFWVVSDGKDMCPWSNKAWTGSAPVLVYSRVAGKKYAEGNAFYADRFIVYLTNDLPSPGRIELPLFRFEEGKALMYTIKSNTGQTAFDTYKMRGHSDIPSDNSLPNLYRSDQLDTLAFAVHHSGSKRIVAEMRTDGEMVAQVVFDVSTDTESVGMMNWFSTTRLVSSHPYKLGTTGFNFFSIAGDQGLKRTFFINKVYGGCDHDIGFWVVSDARDMCPWSSNGWRGSAPVLVYTREAGKKYKEGNAFYADRFLVYLM